MSYLKGYRRYHSYSNYFPLYEHIFAKLEIPKVTKVTKVTNITGIFLVIHIWFWALHYQDYWNSLTFFFVIAQIWHISILMISYPHYLNYSFLSFLELKKYHLSYQITQITKIVNLFQEQNDKIVTIVTNIIHRFFHFEKNWHISSHVYIYKTIWVLHKNDQMFPPPFWQK